MPSAIPAAAPLLRRGFLGDSVEVGVGEKRCKVVAMDEEANRTLVEVVDVSVEANERSIEVGSG